MSAPETVAIGRRHWIVWAVLVVVTASSLVISVEVGDEGATLAIVIVLAAIKALLVLWDFMELDRCPASLRATLLLWPPLVVVVVLILYLILVV